MLFGRLKRIENKAKVFTGESPSYLMARVHAGCGSEYLLFTESEIRRGKEMFMAVIGSGFRRNVVHLRHGLQRSPDKPGRRVMKLKLDGQSMMVVVDLERPRRRAERNAEDVLANMGGPVYRAVGWLLGLLT